MIDVRENDTFVDAVKRNNFDADAVFQFANITGRKWQEPSLCDILFLRNRGYTQSTIAKFYSVSPSYISRKVPYTGTAYKKQKVFFKAIIADARRIQYIDKLNIVEYLIEHGVSEPDACERAELNKDLYKAYKFIKSSVRTVDDIMENHINRSHCYLAYCENPDADIDVVMAWNVLIEAAPEELTDCVYNQFGYCPEILGVLQYYSGHTLMELMEGGRVHYPTLVNLIGICLPQDTWRSDIATYFRKTPSNIPLEALKEYNKGYGLIRLASKYHTTEKDMASFLLLNVLEDYQRDDIKQYAGSTTTASKVIYVDMPGVCALRRAGWTIEAIMSEKNYTDEQVMTALREGGLK